MERDDNVTDAHGAWPRLTHKQIEELSAHGRRRRVAAGEVLFDVGDRVEDLIAILDGRVAIEDDANDAPIAIAGPRCFLGEIGQLTGQASFVRAAAVEPAEVIETPIDALRDVVAGDAALGDMIVRAFLARRWLLIGHGVDGHGVQAL